MSRGDFRTPRALAAGALAVLGLALAASAEEPAPPAPEAAEPAGAAAAPATAEYDEYDELYFDQEPAEEVTHDPIEPVNRGILVFNDGLDRWVLSPVARGWDWVMPDFVERAIRNAFDNLDFPVVFVNELLQGKPLGAGRAVARFAINTTVGIAGLMDPAATIGLGKRDEDFGQTLGVWGLPGGPYLMLPLLGPSNVRDTVGMIVDSGASVVSFFIPFYASAAMKAVETVDRRSLIGDEIDRERRAALDWYAAVRSAYNQYRENQIHDSGSASPGDAGFYQVMEHEKQQTPP
jgi:phospholipid-binding lipoprotein MlaA